ncbi:MAG: hypothetical protein WBP12_04930 [Candidatus Saccharimonas sp.]
MDLLKIHRRRSRLSDVAYIILNIGLALALLFVMYLWKEAWLGVLVVLLSKWRILAVRPRFWFANLVANMVDIIVSISIVVFLAAASGNFWLQLVITLLYVVWLLYIKPRSKREIVAIQAGVAVFVGVTALSIVSYSWDSVFFVLAMWGIGYVATRHILGSYEEPHTVLYGLAVGLIFAELGWIGFHWLMAYQLPGSGNIQLSQLALFTTLFCFVAERAYASYHRYGSIRRADILPAIILTASIVTTVYIFAILFGTDAL